MTTALTANQVALTAVEKTARAISDGSGALPRAMMLPRSKSRSVTSFSTMRSMLFAMAIAMCADGGGKNYVEKHHVEMDAAGLSSLSYNVKVNTMGFRGANSRWVCKPDAAINAGGMDEMDVHNGSAGSCTAHGNHGKPGIQVPEACEKCIGGLPERRVRVSGGDAAMEGVRGPYMENNAKTSEDDDLQLGVQVLLACEKWNETGAVRIQFHGSRPGELQHGQVGGACNDELMDYGWQCSNGHQCGELATWNSSVVNGSFASWKACAATLDGHILYFLDELYVMVDDMLLNYDSISYEMMVAAWMALVKAFMEKFMDNMTVNHMWCCWTASLVACMLVSHLGCATRTSSKSRAKRKQCGARRCQARLQLKAILFASWAVSGQAMEGGEQAFLQRMSSLAEAATSAASAAEKALNLMASSGSSGSTGDAAQAGLSMASRVLKNPDCFTGDDPHSFAAWKFGFCSWLSFGDPRFQRGLEAVEQLKQSEDIKPYSAEEQDLSVKLYSILTSYLRGRCVGLVRSLAKTKDGFRLWRALVTEYEPASRQRSLAVAQALASYPSFPSSKSAMENILNYEALVAQFEELSGQTYPDELKSATLIRCTENRLREHLQLTVGDSTSYGQLKEAILNFEKASKSWTTEAVLKSLNPIADTSNNNGPAPMEVDRIANEKGKGYKGKSNKGKSKGKSWWSFGSYTFSGRGRGRGKGRSNKGKGKGKHKGKSKGKSKDSGKKGNRKGKGVDAQQCRLCLEYGHWSRECPNRMTNQVINNVPPAQNQQSHAQGQQQQGQGGAQQRSSASSSYPPSSSTATTIRRIYGIPSSMISGSSVRMVSESYVKDEKNVIILDSGSDVSLLPLSYGGGVDGPADDAQVQLRDCQGQELKVAGIKTASLVVDDEDGEQAELETQFLVAGNIKSAILSLGQLYQAGWSVSQSNNGPVLESPDHTLRVPVFFVRNSLAIKAEVCRIESADVDLPDSLMVRAVVELEDKFRPEALRYNHWETNVDGNPYMRSVGENFIDPTLVWPATFKYRTTLIQRRSTSDEDHGWCVVEVSRRFLEMEDPFGRIGEIDSYANGEPVTILTILSKENQMLNSFGGFEVEYEPGTPLADGEDEVQGADIGDAFRDEGIQGRDIPEFQQLGPVLHESESADKVVVGEEELTASSSVEKLRRAARFLKVSASGSKQKIFNKIKEAHFTSLKMQALEVARQEYEAMDPRPRFTDAPKQPSAAERKLHEVTHLPFRAWCAFCVQAKSRGYYKHRSTPDERAARTFPTIQVDLFAMPKLHGCAFDS